MIANFERLSSFVAGVTSGLNIGYPKLILEKPEGENIYGCCQPSADGSSAIIWCAWHDDIADEWHLAHELRHAWQALYGDFDHSTHFANQASNEYEEYLCSPTELDAEAFAYALLRELYRDNDDALCWTERTLWLSKGGRKEILDEIHRLADGMDFGFFPYSFVENHRRFYKPSMTPEERLLQAIFQEQ